MLLSGGIVFADTEQKVTINGSTVGKFVNKITFDGDNVTLVYDDNSSQTEDLSLVNIQLTYSTTGIDVVNFAGKKSTNDRVYNLSGQYVGNSLNGLHKGIYIVNGKKIVIK